MYQRDLLLVFGYSGSASTELPLLSDLPARTCTFPASRSQTHRPCRWALPAQSCSWGTATVFCTEHARLLTLQPEFAEHPASQLPKRSHPLRDYQQQPQLQSQLGNGNVARSPQHRVPAAAAGAARSSASVGWNHSLLCRGDDDANQHDGSGSNSCCWLSGDGSGAGCHCSDDDKTQAPLRQWLRVRLPVPGLRIVQVAAGQQHSLALDQAGSVWAWGANHNGQCGIGPHADVTRQSCKTAARAAAAAETVQLLPAAVAVTGAGALEQEGEVERSSAAAGAAPMACDDCSGNGAGGSASCGAAVNNMCSSSSSTSSSSWCAVPLCVLGPGCASGGKATSDGLLLAPGREGGGPEQASVRRGVPELLPVRQVCCGARHSLALDAGGGVWAWGWNGYGQCGRPPPGLAAGGAEQGAAEAGQVAAWGWNDCGQCGSLLGAAG
ncbi:hypothetical protein Agub_g5694, partial [Astrephomene gubernaculifera]